MTPEINILYFYKITFVAMQHRTLFCYELVYFILQIENTCFTDILTLN